MVDETWRAVDEYLDSLLALSDPLLDAALADSAAAGLPAINVAANQGRLLELLAKSHRSRRILEIGTLGGYSTIWLARSLPSDGELVSLELDQRHADVARRNIDRAGLGSLVQLRVAPALDSLRRLIEERVDPFDFIFIDADKEGYSEYFTLSLQLSRLGTVIVADNVVRQGAIVDDDASESRVRGIRSFLKLVAAEERVTATVIQTVGSKGYDGFALVLVTGE